MGIDMQAKGKKKYRKGPLKEGVKRGCDGLWVLEALGTKVKSPASLKHVETRPILSTTLQNTISFLLETHSMAMSSKAISCAAA